MWQWIKFSFRVWLAYWTGWLVINLVALAVGLLVLAALVALDLLLQ